MQVVLQYKQLMSRKLSVISSQNSKVRSGRLISPLHRVQSSVCLTFLVTHQLLAHHASLALLHSFSFVGKFIDVHHMRGCCCWKIKRSTQVRILLTHSTLETCLSDQQVCTILGREDVRNLKLVQPTTQGKNVSIRTFLGQKARWPDVQIARSPDDLNSK